MNKKTLIGSSLCAAMLLSSCDSLSDGTWTRIQGTTIGALGAGGAAAGVAALVSDDEDKAKNALVAGAIGAAVGATLGYVWGDSVAKEKDEYASTEEYVNAHINQLTTRVNDASKTNSELKSQIATLKKNKQKIDSSSYSRIASTVKSNIKTIDSDIEAANKAAQDASAAEKKKLVAQRNALQKQRNAMVSNLNALSSLQARA